MRESDIEKYLHDRVRSYPDGDYRRVSWIGRNGANDDLILIPSEARHMMVECKRPGRNGGPDKPPTIAQQREHDRLRAAGFEVHVVWSYEQIDALLPAPPALP